MTMVPDYGGRGRLGLLIPSGNTAAEVQFSAARPPGMALHWTRLPLKGSTEAELLAMAEGAESGARLLADANVDLIAFHCTAVSTWVPELEAQLLARIEASSGKAAIATSQALTSALRVLHARRILMLSPYVDAIAQREATYFEQRGHSVVGSHNLCIGDPHGMLAVTPDAWSELAARHDRDDVDAIMISCTATRAWEAVAGIEAALRKPVLTSNSAMLWLAVRHLGLTEPLPSCGTIGHRLSNGERCALQADVAA
jgi:maleate isomerase